MATGDLASVVVHRRLGGGVDAYLKGKKAGRGRFVSLEGIERTANVQNRESFCSTRTTATATAAATTMTCFSASPIHLGSITISGSPRHASERASCERTRMNSFLFSSTKLAKYFDARGDSDLILADVAKPRSKGVERVGRDPQGGKLRASVTKLSCARCVKQSGVGQS